MTGIKAMRAELGISQVELATALQVSFTAVNRWENNRSRPNKSAFTLLIRYAKAHGVSESCIEEMHNSYELTRTRQNADQVTIGSLPPIDRELLCQLVEEADPIVYVTDKATDEMLYANRALETELGIKRQAMRGQKCYRFLLGRDTPCPFCHKKELTRDRFFVSSVESSFSGQLYSCRAKEIKWNGRIAHVRYLSRTSNDAVLQHVGCGICVYSIGTDNRPVIRYANEGYCAMCEGTKEEVNKAYKKDYMMGICAEDRQRVQDFVHDVIITHQNGEITFRTQMLKGTFKWLNLKAVYVSGEVARQDKIFCTFLDVSDGMANTVQLRSILSNLPAAMIVFNVCDNRLCVQYISENCINISGFTAAETYARNADGLAVDAHPDAQQYFLEQAWADIKTKRNLSYTFPIRCKDGTYRYVNLSIAPVAVGESQLYYGMMRSTDYNGPEAMLTDIPFPL